eukprot:3754414-Rhodomonas_salina.1
MPSAPCWGAWLGRLGIGVAQGDDDACLMNWGSHVEGESQTKPRTEQVLAVGGLGMPAAAYPEAYSTA